MAKVNQKLVDKLTKKQEKDTTAFNEKKYDLELSSESENYLMTNFIENIPWKGIEVYALTAINADFSANLKDSKGSFSRELIEALFHFIKGFEGKGLQNAIFHKALADQVALVMKEINQDIQDLKDLALEIQAAEQGMTVEQLIKGETDQLQTSQPKGQPISMPEGPVAQ